MQVNKNNVKCADFAPKSRRAKNPSDKKFRRHTASAKLVCTTPSALKRRVSCTAWGNIFGEICLAVAVFDIRLLSKCVFMNNLNVRSLLKMVCYNNLSLDCVDVSCNYVLRVLSIFVSINMKFRLLLQ